MKEASICICHEILVFEEHWILESKDHISSGLTDPNNLHGKCECQKGKIVMLKKLILVLFFMSSFFSLSYPECAWGTQGFLRTHCCGFHWIFRLLLDASAKVGILRVSEFDL